MSTRPTPEVEPPVTRFVRRPVVAGECPICKGPTVRPLGMTPIPRADAQGGEAGFRICKRCDKINPAPPKPLVR